ncbi:hypothetical protein SBI_03625 [Streptomyces bingchenggensis BCW-1]|uniref:Uncharacterized protein n=1 Tax=Streptomyces bingchenggensis (strain BCW-1) TaxID=749414 RepID=D7CE59_STRBB|nr:hypothetical protein SBI_03625 [Streptomyces bingchenggensis BCW-1]
MVNPTRDTTAGRAAWPPRRLGIGVPFLTNEKKACTPG